MNFHEISPLALSQNVFSLIEKGKPLLTVEADGIQNAMTVNWGQLGYLWNCCVATIYVRPQRFTFPLLEKSEAYSLCFFEEAYQDKVAYCGKASGRDGDKLAHCGFTVEHQGGIAYLKEASLVLLCRKKYSAFLTPDGFSDVAAAGTYYAQGDYHKMYTGKIITVLAKDD